MIRARRDAWIALTLAVVVAAGCSKSPKPDASIPAASDSAKAAAAAAKKTTNGTAARPGKNGASFPGTSTGSSTSAPAIVPQVAPAEQDKMVKETTAAIEGAQKALDQLDVARLDPERARKHVIAKDFLAQANEALTRREYERAQGLAVKAKLLAEEIGK